MPQAYADLADRFARISNVEGALAVLSWDAAVVMPKGGAEGRGEQTAVLKRFAHDLITAPVVAERLAQADDETLDEWQRANLVEMKRRHVQATAIPSDLVEAIARVTTTCEMIWRDARAKSDFAELATSLTEVVRLTRAQAEALGAAQGLSPYDALLDLYEANLRDSTIEPIFTRLGQELPGISEAVIARQPKAMELSGPFPIERQKLLARDMMAAVDFDLSQGRLDESAHPFSGGIPGDVRITTRYEEADFLQAMMGVLHELGHAQYTAGQPVAWRHQPVGDARGMIVHESQSLFTEMQASRSRPFTAFLAGRARAVFEREDDPALSAENLSRLVNRVQKSLIRVEADETTYPLHIVLRWRLEKAMINGDLSVADLPAAWNDGMRELLGIVPPDDRRGCLQDIHWPVGAFGYFPCYTLGALMAAQLFRAMLKQVPDALEHLGRGSFGPILAWQRENVHQQGCRYTFDQLLARITGETLGPDAFLDHLRLRYLSGA
ncbi:MAG TPA: carboxypeptidase M32 [Geminicoccus sp.]|uniref:carboxypeptidase M32 n=1 Tax=Geminicoccus sp. TaxID=2024832 RepID=UPI002E3056FD|nr:carboxypeptidase M32 [Geminicoccus sp.]HEX2529232.1 carboxypeptidase M32 [Geminicoccus sp.]